MTLTHVYPVPPFKFSDLIERNIAPPICSVASCTIHLLPRQAATFYPCTFLDTTRIFVAQSSDGIKCYLDMERSRHTNHLYLRVVSPPKYEGIGRVLKSCTVALAKTHLKKFYRVHVIRVVHEDMHRDFWRYLHFSPRESAVKQMRQV